MDNELKTKPVWQLTTDELVQVLSSQLVEVLASQIKKGQPYREVMGTTSECANESKYVYGIAGVSELFGCSKQTASRMKRSGFLNKAIYQSEKPLIVDRKIAISLIKKTKWGKKYY
jgi:hypothetical protein